MKIIDTIQIDDSVEQWVEIETAKGQFTSMLKSTYDEQQAAQAHS